MTALDLSIFDKPIEPVIIRHTPIDDNGNFQLDESGQPVVIKTQHNVRPLDAIAYQMAQKAAIGLGDDATTYKFLRRIVPTISDLEIEQMTPEQMTGLIAISRGRLDEVLEALGKDMGPTAEVPAAS